MKSAKSRFRKRWRVSVAARIDSQYIRAAGSADSIASFGAETGYFRSAEGASTGRPDSR